MRKGAKASSQSIRHLLFMSKALHVDVNDYEGVNLFLKAMMTRDMANETDESEDLIYFIKFAARYIESITVKLNVLKKHKLLITSIGCDEAVPKLSGQFGKSKGRSVKIGQEFRFDANAGTK